MGLFHCQVVSPSKASKKYDVSLIVCNRRPTKMQLKYHGCGNSNVTNIRQTTSCRNTISPHCSVYRRVQWALRETPTDGPWPTHSLTKLRAQNLQSQLNINDWDNDLHPLASALHYTDRVVYNGAFCCVD
jgi:hypothetical protein